MARYRINSTRIKLNDDAEGARGGQGIVVVGTLTLEEAFQGMSEAPEEFCSDGYKESVPEELKELLPEELSKIVSERKGKLNREREVAVKKLHWPHDDTEQSTKVFKVCCVSYSLVCWCPKRFSSVLRERAQPDGVPFSSKHHRIPGVCGRHREGRHLDHIKLGS